MHRSNQSNTWYCPRCDTHVATKFGCYCNANAQTIVEAELAKTEPAQTKVDSSTIQFDEAYNMLWQYKRLIDIIKSTEQIASSEELKEFAINRKNDSMKELIALSEIVQYRLKQCDQCQTVYSQDKCPHCEHRKADSVGIQPAPLKDADGFLLDMNNPVVKNIWNAAIEAAAIEADGWFEACADEIRKLKK